ncbi:MAG TPA: hypothetical protein PK511_00590 [Chitinophagales bacterium]|nr:hypothetical protein [Chitinophagales bacterium]HMU70358.1 hypothetical protein [Chitinophagales bacterium]HMX03174.1 hypothetical protein [Chitinophagales bacterium]HMZ89729.1 hypothetical protein [Chitinophagales bacterium]HNA56506.1 hypothetical protein [Chitinophagales bacterium]
MLSATAASAILAYGGETFWKEAKNIEAEVSVRGWAFRLKWRPFFDHVHIKLDAEHPFSQLTPIGSDLGVVAVLDGDDVHLEDLTGEISKFRSGAKHYFPYGRRLLYWDDLDMGYFANYAFWNYFTLPKLLLRDDIKWIETKYGVLHAIFPDHIPTHCKEQQFTFDTTTGLLKQHDYTAEVISGLATAAHVIHEHQTKNGITFASRRIVTPRTKTGKAMKAPVLIDITVHDLKIS